MPHPVGLTDSELDVISSAARPIAPILRAAFIEAVMNELAPYPVLGPALVHRTCRDLQRRFVSAPPLSELNVGKYSRGAA